MQTHVRQPGPRRPTVSFQSGRKEMTQKEAQSTVHVHSAAHPNSLEPAGQSPPRSRASRQDPRRRPASPPRSRVANLPSSGQLIAASLENTSRHKGQTALPLTCPSYGGIKCQPLLHKAQDRRRQAAIPHSGCDRSPVRQLRSLLRHSGRCGYTVEPATRDETGSALLPLLFCQLRTSGLHLITRMAPDPLPA